MPGIDPGANTLPQTSSLMIQKIGQCTLCKPVGGTKLGVTDMGMVVLPFQWTLTGWRMKLRVNEVQQNWGRITNAPVHHPQAEFQAVQLQSHKKSPRLPSLFPKESGPNHFRNLVAVTLPVH